MTRSSLLPSASARLGNRPASSASRKARKPSASRSPSPSLQRMAARRIDEAADASDELAKALRRTARQKTRWVGANSRLRALARLQETLELATAMQIKWETHRLGVRRSARRKVDDVARSMDQSSPLRLSRARRVDRSASKVLGEVEALAASALDAVENHQKRRVEMGDAVVDLTGEGEREREAVLRIPDAPLLPPQQLEQPQPQQMRMPREHVPWFLWRMYADSFWNTSATERLRCAMQEVVVAIRDVNPYFFLKTIHRPNSRLGGRNTAPSMPSDAFRLKKTKSVKGVIADLLPLFIELHKRGCALASTDGEHRFRKGWCELRSTLELVRRFALHFHLVMLHLYAKAMKDPAISQSAIKPLIADAQKMDVRLRATLALPEECANSPDDLVRDTYEYAPELLVFLDVWRDQPDWDCDPDVVTRYGYGPHEHFQAFLPVFDNYSTQPSGSDALRDLGCEINEIHNVWYQSELATSSSKYIGLESIGSVEKTIKHRIRGIMDLTYKITLARWMELRANPERDEWWRHLTLRVSSLDKAEPVEKHQGQSSSQAGFGLTDKADTSCPESSTSLDKPAVLSVEDHPAVVEDGNGAGSPEVIPSSSPLTADDYQRRAMVRSVDPTRGDGGFRAPASVKHHELLASARQRRVSNSSLSTIPPRKPSTGVVLLEDVYEWSDDEIDQHEREMEHICEVRNELLSLRESLVPAKLEHNAAQCMREHWSEPLTLSDVGPGGECLGDSESLALAAVCVQARALSETVAACGEEIAMHEAAEALIKNPGLRDIATDPTEDEVLLTDDDGDDDGNGEGSDASQQQIGAAEAVQTLQEQFRGITGADCSRKRGAARLANAALSSLTLIRLLNEALARQNASWQQQQQEELVEAGGATLDVTVDAT